MHYFNMKKIIIVILVFLALLPLSVNKIAHAHEDELHDNNKAISNPSVLDEFEVLKETQFLFDIHTRVSNNSKYNSILKIYGKVMPATNGSAKIISPQNGTVVSLNVNIGQRVAQGQILAILEQNLNTFEIVQLSTEKNNANAEYESSKKEYERLKSIQDIVAKKDFQLCEIRYKTAETNKKIFDNLTSSSSKLYSIKSPISGVVDNFNLSIGQQLEQGNSMFNIYETKKVKLEAQVFDKDLKIITKDVNFLVECVQGNHKTETAKLLAVSNVVNPLNQSSEIILEIDNEEGDFKPGQFVNVAVLAKTEKKYLVIPTSAISEINGKPVVFIHHEPEVFKIKFVQVGEGNIENTIILNGLDENERIVTNGTYQVKSIYLNH